MAESATIAGAARVSRPRYLRRVLQVYLSPSKSPLAFWYETPEVNPRAFAGGGEYWMTFRGKADYRGPFDTRGIPLLDYRGEIGRQYNPIAIAQYGLACWNRFRATGEASRRAAFLATADWLVDNLEPNRHGLGVWHHRFDWPYRQTLRAPWYSGLAQGQGVSLLVRAAEDTGRDTYRDGAIEAFRSLAADVERGGVLVRDARGRPWIEEYLVEPPSHILNGFLWALWGVYDYARWSGDQAARALFEACVDTLAESLHRYDTGSWSLYELPAGGPPMPASLYYHRLHVVQLAVMHRLTGRDVFDLVSRRWADYAGRRTLRTLALVRKAWFKLRHY